MNVFRITELFVYLKMVKMANFMLVHFTTIKKLEKTRDVEEYIVLILIKARIAILVSDKADFRIRKIIRDKTGHYIIIKGPLDQAGQKSARI